MTNYIISHDGNITLWLQDKTYVIGKHDPNYKAIRDSLSQKEVNLAGLLNQPQQIVANTAENQIKAIVDQQNDSTVLRLQIGKHTINLWDISRDDIENMIEELKKVRNSL